MGSTILMLFPVALTKPDVDQPGLRRHPLAGERPAAGVAAHVRCPCACRTCAATRPRCTCPRSRASAAWAASTLFHGWRLSTGLPSGSCVTNVAARSAQSSKYELPSRIRIIRLISTRSVVTSSPLMATPGVTKRAVAPLAHVLVLVELVRALGVVERAPAHQVGVPVADHVVPRQRLEEEVVQVVVHGDRALRVVHVAHQPHVVVGHRLVRDVRAAPARHDRRGVGVAPAEQAVHLARVARHLEGLQVEVAGERVQRPHDVGDRLVAVDVHVRRRRALGLLRAATGWSP